MRYCVYVCTRGFKSYIIRFRNSTKHFSATRHQNNKYQKLALQQRKIVSKHIFITFIEFFLNQFIFKHCWSRRAPIQNLINWVYPMPISRICLCQMKVVATTTTTKKKQQNRIYPICHTLYKVNQIDLGLIANYILLWKTLKSKANKNEHYIHFICLNSL